MRAVEQSGVGEYLEVSTDPRLALPEDPAELKVELDRRGLEQHSCECYGVVDRAYRQLRSGSSAWPARVEGAAGGAGANRAGRQAQAG